MIAIVDYGAGNVRSVKNALDFIRVRNKITAKPDDIRAADKIILPGVGSFGDIMEYLNRKKLIDVLKESVGKKPYLGICLGMQILFERSEESKGNGLGVFKGDVKRLKPGLKVPHIGWNSINIARKNRLLQGIKKSSYFYFVHSYHAVPRDKGIVMTRTDYGQDFVSGIAEGNIFGVQFHPERSGDIGLRMLRNFDESDTF